MLFLLSNLVFATPLKYSDIADGRPKDIKKGYLSSYETKAGYTVKTGYTIMLNTPSELTAKTLTIGGGTSNFGIAAANTTQSSYFQYIYNGTYAATIGKLVLASLTGDSDPTLYQAPVSLSGSEVTNSRLELAGTKRRPMFGQKELSQIREKRKISLEN